MSGIVLPPAEKMAITEPFEDAWTQMENAQIAITKNCVVRRYYCGKSA